MNDRDVFDLTVEGAHEFLANGIVVHNCDEVAAWQYDREAFDMIMFSLRLGQHPRMIITTTPKPKALIRDLLKRKDVLVKTASTFDNLKNLAPTFREQILAYDGTTLGRQEIHAEMLDPEEQGIIRRSWLKLWPNRKPLPTIEYILMSLDTAATEATRDKETGDPDYTACQVWGLFYYDERPNVMLLDAWEERLGFPELLERVRTEMLAEYGAVEEPIVKPKFGPSKVKMLSKKIDMILIEKAGSGIGLIQMLRKEGVPVSPYNPGRMDKLSRLHAVSHYFSNGLVWLVESDKRAGEPKSWASNAVEQWCTFSGEGTIPHDDHVDAGSQALRFLGMKNMVRVNKPNPRETDPVPVDARNPYDL